METKNNEINYTFKVLQSDEVIIERSFPASNFNPLTRYSVNIRKIIPSISNRLQSVLSSNTSDLDTNDYGYDLVGEYVKSYECFSKNFSHSKLKKPNDVSVDIDYTNASGEAIKKVITGVPFKFGLYIDDNKPIVERDFYVRNYNPRSRFSFDLYHLISEIVDEIYEYLIKKDIKNTWDDFSIINQFGYNIQDIIEMSEQKRSMLIKKLN